MINRESLKALVQSLLGEHINCDWAGDPEHWIGFSGIGSDGYPDNASKLGANATLSITSVSGVGTDDMRRNWNAIDEIQTIEQVGIRHIELQIQIQTGGEILAASLTERLITGFQRRSTLNALWELDCALRKVNEVRGVNVPSWDNKFADSAIVEVSLTWGNAATDPVGETGAEVPNNWIQTVTPLTKA